MVDTPLRLDFLEDLRVELAAILAATGRPIKAGLDCHDVCAAYYNGMRKTLPQRLRRVLWSNELRAKKPGLSRRLRQGIEAVDNAIRRGGDLVKYLSKGVTRPASHDLLLNDWGLYHFHLGAQGGAPFVDRSDELLVAHVDDDTARLVDVIGHGEWDSPSLLPIMHENWPDLMEQFRLNGVSSAGATQRDVARLRKVGVNLAHERPDGSVFAAPGGGFMLNGLSFDVALRIDQLMSHVHEIELWARDSAEWILTEVNARAPFPVLELDLRLIVEEVRDELAFYAEHTATRQRFRVPTTA